jgi:hypothetical protein
MKSARLMNIFQGFVLGGLFSVLFAVSVQAGNKGPRVEFGIDGLKTKIDNGTQGGWIPMYGPGNTLVLRDGVVHAFYTSETIDRIVEIRTCSSDDGGRSWGASSIIASSASFGGNGAAVALGPDPATPGQTLFHVTWADSRFARSILYSRGGAMGDMSNWSAPVIVSGLVEAIDHTRSIAADEMGGVHIAFIGRSTSVSGRGVFYSGSSDGGATFGEIAVPVAIETADEPDIAVDDLGNVFIAWKGPYVDGQRQLRFSKRPVGASGFAPAITINSLYEGYYGSVELIDQNNICVAFAFGGVAVACTTNGGSLPSDWTEYLVTEEPADLAHLAVSSDGVWNLTWTGWGYPAGVYFSRSTTGVNRWMSPVLVDADGDNSPKIVVDDDGAALIAYPNKAWTVLYLSRER